LFDDRELWKKISAGNAESFDAFYRDNGPRLRAFLRHLLSSEQAAEDIMQDTFTHIWRRPQGFNRNSAVCAGTCLASVGSSPLGGGADRNKPTSSKKSRRRVKRRCHR
jgi:hypothetical protein